jgi:hypothetical protein
MHVCKSMHMWHSRPRLCPGGVMGWRRPPAVALILIRANPRKSAVRGFVSYSSRSALQMGVPPSPFLADTTRNKGFSSNRPKGHPWATQAPPNARRLPLEPKAESQWPKADSQFSKITRAPPRPQTSHCVIPRKREVYQCQNLSINAWQTGFSCVVDSMSVR